MGIISFALFCFSAAAWADLILYYDFEDTDPNAIDKSGYGHDALAEWGFPDNGSHPEWETLPQLVTETLPNGSSTVMRFGYDDAGNPGVTFNDLRVGDGYNETLAYLGQYWSMGFWCRQDRNTDYTGVVPPGSTEPLGYTYSRIISCPNYEVELGAAGYLNNAAWFWPYQASPAWNSGTNVGSWDMYLAVGSPDPIPPYQEWFHMIITYDGTTLRQYVNGTEVYSNDTMPSAFVEATWSTVYPGSTLRIGVQATDWQRSFFCGLLDDVAVWAHGYLDADAVAGLYDGTYDPTTVPLIEENPKFPEEIPDSFLFNTTFINEYNGGYVFGPNEIWAPHAPWNWNIQNDSGISYAYGIQNVSEWDNGDPNIIKYAAYVTVDCKLSQDANPSAGAWSPIREGINYNLKARVAGFGAVGNKIKVEFYKASQTDPNDVELIVDPNVTSVVITKNQKWIDLYAPYTSTAADDNKYFKAVAYIEQISGGGMGEAWAYFDSIVIRSATRGAP